MQIKTDKDCPYCHGSGAMWVQNGPDDVDKDICVCAEITKGEESMARTWSEEQKKALSEKNKALWTPEKRAEQAERARRQRAKQKANQIGRERALAKRDKPKRKYNRRAPKLNGASMNLMVSVLEGFILEVPQMKASEYLEKRQRVIIDILAIGGKYAKKDN